MHERELRSDPHATPAASSTESPAARRAHRKCAAKLGHAAIALMLAGCGTLVEAPAAESQSAAVATDSSLGTDSAFPVATSGTSGGAPTDGALPDDGKHDAAEGALGPVSGTGRRQGESVGARDEAPSGGGTSASTSGPAFTGPGVSGTAIRVGFQYIKTEGGTEFVLGHNVSIGDPEKQARAVANYINKHGGLGGRKLEFVPFGIAYADFVNNQQAAHARTCAYFTEDVKVFAVGLAIPDRMLVQCLAKKDVISIASLYNIDAAAYRDHPNHFFSPGAMSLDRGAVTAIDTWASTGFFKDAKIGLVRVEERAFERAEGALRAALQKYNLKLAQVSEVAYGNSGRASNDASAAVLRMRQNGITHVLFLDQRGSAAFYFMPAAESQGYRPFYGLTTNNGAGLLRDTTPKEQFRKASAVSWSIGDTTEANQTPPAYPKARETCFNIYKDAGIAPASGAEKTFGSLVCDQFLLLKAALDTGATPNSTSFTAAVNGLGTTFSSALTYVSRFSPRHHDSALKTRLLRDDAGCSCWKYAGPGRDST